MEQLITPGDAVQSMTNIVNNLLLLRANILIEMITAMGIVMLGAMMYKVLKSQNGNLAAIAFGLYVFEAAILAVSRIPTFSMIRVSQASIANGHPQDLQFIWNLLYDAQEFGYTLHMLPFTLGATIFYSLMFKSGITPRWLSYLGIIAAPIALAGMAFVLMGVDVPLWIFLPNLPFELMAGVWFLLKGNQKKPVKPAIDTGSLEENMHKCNFFQ